MPSKAYLATTLVDSSSKKPVAVIVYEGTETTDLNFDAIKAHVAANREDLLRFAAHRAALDVQLDPDPLAGANGGVEIADE